MHRTEERQKSCSNYTNHDCRNGHDYAERRNGHDYADHDDDYDYDDCDADEWKWRQPWLWRSSRPWRSSRLRKNGKKRTSWCDPAQEEWQKVLCLGHQHS
jgi:hypothetical protein